LPGPSCDGSRYYLEHLIATFYLSYLGIGGERIGSFLWPAVVVHSALTILLVLAWLKDERPDISLDEKV
jgi:hypothetical protein